MRLVIDMQGAQTTASRTRGIGRYTASLVQALVRNRGEHEIILALNGLFPDTIEPVRASVRGFLPQENIRVWDVPGRVDYLSAPPCRLDIAERMRECFLAHMKPDVLLVSSLFEGLVDNAVTSIGKTAGEIPTAVILYDIIPYIHRKPYLEEPVVERWYLEKIDHLRRADLLLSISESSRQETIRYLHVDGHSVINISTAADAQFMPRDVPPSRRNGLKERYGLNRPLIMYTGGIDYRKNVEGLIRAYAGLQTEIREKHQLAIVCSVQKRDRRRLIDLGAEKGLKPNDLIITGFIPDEDLVDLYNLCTVFVFPSFHEGFGLPILEAMACGAPVLGSNTSSLPEVIGRDDALFDPHDDRDIAVKLSRVLTDEPFRKSLVQHGLERARQFSWDTTAKRALSALERQHREREGRQITVTGGRPKLAYVSPLPPARSGISDYSAELLPELARFYEIDVVVAQEEVAGPIAAAFPVRTVEWFREHAGQYARVLYHFGNSAFHQHMFGLLREFPGVVVLHDFFLSGVLAYMDARGALPGGWVLELYASHGYRAVQRLFHATGNDVIYGYPSNLGVLQNAQGIIVHSKNSLRLARKWYTDDTSDWAVIPLLRDPHVSRDRIGARKALDFRDSDFLVCAFGLLGPPKLNQNLLRAWLNSPLARDKSCYLIFVGENDGGDYGRELVATIRDHQAENNIRITGWADIDVFRKYLAAADVAVQLRTLSRGETSAAVFDCMNFGLATIVNANGSMADLDDDGVWKLPDDYTDAQLKESLERLWNDAEARRRLGTRAREIILEKHSPGTCATQYREAIERFHASSANSAHALISTIAGLDCPLDDRDLIDVSLSIARCLPLPFRARQLLVDVSALLRRDPANAAHESARRVLHKWLTEATSGLRVEPVYGTKKGGYRYARQFALDLLNCPRGVLEDDPVDFSAEDVFLGLGGKSRVVAAQRGFFQRLRDYGVQVYFAVYELRCKQAGQSYLDDATETEWLEVVAESDGALCSSKSVADEFAAWLEANGPKRSRPLTIDWNPDVEDSAPIKVPSADSSGMLDHFLRSRVFRQT